MSKRSESILTFLLVIDIIYIITQALPSAMMLSHLIAYSQGKDSYLFDQNSIGLLKLHVGFYILAVLFLAFFIIKWIKDYKHYKAVSSYRHQLYAKKLAYFYKKPILTTLFMTDPNFSIDKFLIRAKRMYIAFIHNLAQENLTALQLVLSPVLYLNYEETLSAGNAPFAKSSLTSKRDTKKLMQKVFIQHIHIHDYYEECDTAYLTVGMLIETRQLSKKRLQPKEIKKCMLTFSRHLSAKTKANSDLFDTEHCPNCGAPLVISLKGDCNYCGASISSNKFAWCIHHIEEEFIERLDYGIGDW